ncbi:hypothetical protein UlMin_029049 [Ulmus minor]
MMIVQMDKMSAPPSRERAQLLYDKIMELENRRRRSAQARIPSDPNAWQQIRENYEAIILEDHAFSEKLNIEYALWQLHYKRIEELRAHFSAAIASSSNTSQSVKGPTRPDRITKIRLQFKTFLSEASGFYHDLIVKIKAKYGLPLGNFSEDSENQNAMEKDGKKSLEVKKGLISCHRCLIYLGDLARYKGLYGDGDSKTREFAAASSYYLQAASLCPSSGNPHHQLAILSSYSGDELVAVYRYFRSLAVDSPFSTARENLIVAFEKNRNSYSQLPRDSVAPGAKDSVSQLADKARGKGEAKPTNTESSHFKEGASGVHETYKSFCVRFVRLNGILFTHTSLETFAEVLSLVSGGLRKLLSSGLEEEHNFGADAFESGLVIVRLVAILTFTVHNLNKDSEGQTYAEILQRNALLQNAFTAVFELMSHILERCVQLRDPSSSFLLPGILVFLEWLACCPNVAAGSDKDEKQATVRSKFWNLFVSFLNKLFSVGSMSLDDDEDETCFNNMSRYEEGNTENRLALWEDIELRGFLPLLPAQTLLDFSRKHAFGSDGQKDKRNRIKRILAAGRALASVVRVDNKEIFLDSKLKKFVIGVEPQMLDNSVAAYSGMPNNDNMMQENRAEKATNSGATQMNQQLFIGEDEEDEVIVFKPIVVEKRFDAVNSNWATYEGLNAGRSASPADIKVNGFSISTPLDNLHQVFDGVPKAPISVSNVPQYMQPVQSHVSKWLTEEVSLANSFNGLMVGNGHVGKSYLQEGNHVPLSAPFQQSVNARGNGHSGKSHLQEDNHVPLSVPFQQSVDARGNGHSGKSHLQEDNYAPLSVPFQQSVDVRGNGHVGGRSHLQEDDHVSLSVPFQQSVNASTSGMFYSHMKAPETSVQSVVDVIASSGAITSSLPVKTPSASLSPGLRRNPVSRPSRHLGPPPGFSSVPSKPVNESISGSDLASECPIMDDYSWLDGYQVPSSMRGPMPNDSSIYPPHSNVLQNSSSNGLSGSINFPFPGKQAPTMQFQAEKQRDWQDYSMLDNLKLHHEQQLQQQQQQQLLNGNPNFKLPQQFQGQPGWTGRHFV